jgi:hypothetical protein
LALPIKPKTASDLAKRILVPPRGGLDKLMSVVGDNEKEWLEFKASSSPETGILSDGENLADYRWNIAKAVISIANSIGGVILLGVDDNGGVVGIDASDPKNKRAKNGLEAFRREVILQQVLFPNNGWKTGKNGLVRLLNSQLLQQLVELEEIPCGNKNVLAIFVDPVPNHFGYLEVEINAPSKPVKRCTYVRRRGAVGQIAELNIMDQAIVNAHLESRKNVIENVSLEWDKFLHTEKFSRSHEELLPEISGYMNSIVSKGAAFNNLYVPLKANRQILQNGKLHESGNKSKADADDWATNPTESSILGDQGQELVIGAHSPNHSLPVLEVLQTERTVLLLGEGGSGKSETLKASVFENASKWVAGKTFPIHLKMSEYSHSGLAGLAVLKTGIDWQDIVPLISAGKVSFYLDCINECPANLYDLCIKEITSLIREYPNVRFILSSRNNPFSDDLEVSVFHLEPLSFGQQSEFLLNYSVGEKSSQAILDTLKNENAQAIGEKPILLRILAEVVIQTGAIPTQRSKLYQQFIISWFQREVSQKEKVGRVFAWSYSQCKNALTDLAYQIRRKGQSSISPKATENILLPYLGESTPQFVDWITTEKTLIETAPSGYIRFTHESFEEFLCAEYLVDRNEDIDTDMLCFEQSAKPNIWAMPIALAFEILDEPSLTFLNAAWIAEPLITAISSKNNEAFDIDELSTDNWTALVLSALLGKKTCKLEREITLIARLPPKYPISDYLLATISNRGFWYSAETHNHSKIRIKKLNRLLLGRGFPWVELVPFASSGQNALRENLNGPLRAITGTSSKLTINELLSTATISELCAMRRRKLISGETFASSWQDILDRADIENIELKLLDIIRTEKKIVSEIVRAMLPRYKSQLRRIAFEKELSLRILNILVRMRVVSSKEIRSIPGFLQYICERMSLMNAIRLGNSGVIRRTDLDAETITRLIYDIKSRVNQFESAVKTGVLKIDDLPKSLQELLNPQALISDPSNTAPASDKFTKSELMSDWTRTKISKQLETSRFIITLSALPKNRDFAFAIHTKFDGDIFILKNKIAEFDWESAKKGDQLDVRISVSFNRTKKVWGFSVDAGRRAM